MGSNSPKGITACPAGNKQIKFVSKMYVNRFLGVKCLLFS
jgi:hypothetical protein